MKKIVIAVAAAALASTAAYAAVTLDTETGTGYVGKGDVQSAFGWTNKQLQSSAKEVGFFYRGNNRYTVTCEWTTVTGGPNSRTTLHDVEKTENRHISSSVAYEPKTKNQLAGFNLKGFVSATAEAPAEGDACPNGGQGEITEVELTSSTGNLFATHGTKQRQLD